MEWQWITNYTLFFNVDCGVLSLYDNVIELKIIDSISAHNNTG